MTQDAAGARQVILGNTKQYMRTRPAMVAVVDLPQVVTSAGVAKAGKNFILVASEKTEQGKFLVRVNSEGQYKRGNFGGRVFRGQPIKVVEGDEETGSTNVTHYHDQLWVIGERDVVKIDSLVEEDRFSGRVLFVEDGVLKFDHYKDWSLRDARKNPAPYITDGWCPIDRIPQEWVGRIVELQNEDRSSYDDPLKLLAITPEIALERGWNSPAEKDRSKSYPTQDKIWVHLREDLKAESPITIVKEYDEVEFASSSSDSPLPDGTQVVATIVQDGKTTTLTVVNVPGRKYHVTEYVKDGQPGKTRDDQGAVKAVYTLPKYDGSRVVVPDGFQGLLSGTYLVTFYSPRRRPWYIQVVKEVAAVEGPVVDHRVWIRKNVSAHIWVIDGNGNIFVEKTCDNEVAFMGIPESSLVLVHQWHYFGYSYNEVFEVHRLPENTTAAQLATAQRIATEEKHYLFVGEGATWDFSKLGKVYFTMSNRSFTEEQRIALNPQFPLNVAEFRHKDVKPNLEVGEQDHPVVKQVEVFGPEKK